MEIKTYLAPMAGYTDSACRTIYHDFNVDMFTTEMVSAKALYYGDKKTMTLMSSTSKEKNLAVQIFGSDAKIMAHVVEKYINPMKNFTSVDINMGCPAPKIVKTGAGSALLQNEMQAYEIMKSVVSVSNKPVTVKIRKGIGDSLKGLDIAILAEKAGISEITVHGRTREMYYSGEADWDFIKEVAERVDIPVIGNGDISSFNDALTKIEHSNVDGVAIGRAAIGNPWIFKEIYCYSKGVDYSPPTAYDKITTAIEHLNLACTLKGERIGVKEMRKHFMGYLKGLRNASVIRDNINKLNSQSDIVTLLKAYELEEGFTE